jgi:hypothetical protein
VAGIAAVDGAFAPAAGVETWFDGAAAVADDGGFGCMAVALVDEEAPPSSDAANQ